VIMASDLYRELGVGRNASTATIRSAYRKKAKTAHPDAGGSEEAFAMLKLAHDVLTNAEARGRYDRTGEVKPQAVDQGRMPLFTLLASVLENVVQASINGNADLAYEDVIDAMRIVLKKHADELDKAQELFTKKLAGFKKMQGRFRTKKDGEENLIGQIVDGRIASLETDLAGVAGHKAMVDEAMKVIDSHAFRREVRQQMKAQAVYMQMMSQQSTSTTGGFFG